MANDNAMKAKPHQKTSEDPPKANASGESTFELRILRSIRRVIRAVDIHSKKLFSKTNLTGPQLLSLMVVGNEGPLTSVELGRHVYLSPSTIVGILDRLEAKGLVTRTRDTTDRRKVHIDVTPEGQKILALSPMPLQDKLADALSTLPESEKSILATSLERIVELMEAEEIDAAPILQTGEIDTGR